VVEYQRALPLTLKLLTSSSPFANKVANVRQNTSGVPSPTFSRVQKLAYRLMRSRLTTDDVINAVRRLPDKSSAADPLPTTVLIQVIDLLSPFITELFSRLLATGRLILLDFVRRLSP